MRKRLAKLSDLEFFMLMAKAKELELVIKSAIVVETAMEDLFSAAFEKPQYIFDMNMKYEQKIGIALAIGLDERFKAPLTTLANLRNKFAHNLNVAFGKDEAKNFFGTFHKIDRAIARDNYYSLMDGDGSAFEKLAADELFIISVITLRAAIISTTMALDLGSPKAG